MLDALRHQCDQYYQEIPDHIPDAAFKSAVFSFAISAILSGNVDVGLRTAAVAATVSIISGLTMPIFRHYLADQNKVMQWHRFAATQIVNLAITQFLVNSTTNYRINLMSSVFFTVIVSGVLMGFSDIDTRYCPYYIFA